jgi:hypothetical protein
VRQRSSAEVCQLEITASRPSSRLLPRAADFSDGGSGQYYYYDANYFLISSKITDHDRYTQFPRSGLTLRDCLAGALAHNTPLRFNFSPDPNSTLRAATKRPAASSHRTTQMPQTNRSDEILRRKKFQHFQSEKTSTYSTPRA